MQTHRIAPHLVARTVEAHLAIDSDSDDQEVFDGFGIP